MVGKFKIQIKKREIKHVSNYKVQKCENIQLKKRRIWLMKKDIIKYYNELDKHYESIWGKQIMEINMDERAIYIIADKFSYFRLCYR